VEREKSREFTHHEVMHPPIWLLAFLLFLLGSLALSVWAAFNDFAGVVSMIIGIALVMIFRQRFALEISVTLDELRVGGAHIERKYIGETTVLTANEMQLTRGRDADPAAFLAIRFWLPAGVKVTLNDKRDPTPYWLISSKKPSSLAKALNNS
jgi:hypothetical protein